MLSKIPIFINSLGTRAGRGKTVGGAGVVGYLQPRLCAAALCLLPATGASAAGWTMPAGEGRIITNGFFSNSDKAFDDRGKAVDIPDYRKTEVYALAEYGITDDLTLIVTPSFRDVSVRRGSDSSGLGYTDIGARYRLTGSPTSVLSVQAVARIPGKRREDNLAQVGNTDAEYDLRAQYGTSFGGADRGGFLIVEGGYRIRTDDPPNEFRADVTLGYRPTSRLLLLGSVFSTISDGSGRGIFGKHRYHNLYASGVYDVSPRVALQLGAMGTIDGRNALRERGLFAGLWFRFGSRLRENPDR